MRVAAAEFGPPGPLRDRLVTAIVSGCKTTTSSLAADYGAKPLTMPVIGDVQVVLGSSGEAAAVIEIVNVRVVPLSEVDWQHASGEGEGFASVAAWRAAHEEFWGPVDSGHRTLCDQDLVVLEQFRLLDPSRSDWRHSTRAG